MAKSNASSDVKPTTEQVPGNPTGKGGFGDHPENRNPGGWRKEVSFSYQYKRFMAMSLKELEDYAATSKEKRTVVEDLAYKRVYAAQKSLADVKEITDRTEGKAPQSVEVTGKDGDPIESITSITYMPKQLPDDYFRQQTDNTSK